MPILAVGQPFERESFQDNPFTIPLHPSPALVQAGDVAIRQGRETGISRGSVLEQLCNRPGLAFVVTQPDGQFPAPVHMFVDDSRDGVDRIAEQQTTLVTGLRPGVSNKAGLAYRFDQLRVKLQW